MNEKETIFLSDVHLSEHSPGRTKLFCDQISKHGINKDIYILGDLFDAWVGDEQARSWIKPVEDTLALACKNNCNIYIMHGNHDFLLSEKMIARLSAKQISDPYILNGNILLTHGDDFCLNDEHYRKIKPWIRNEISIKLFLMLPINIKYKIARKLQGFGRSKKIDQESLNRLFTGKVDTIIHGHMHRENWHIFNGNLCVCLDSWEKKSSIALLARGKLSLIS